VKSGGAVAMLLARRGGAVAALMAMIAGMAVECPAQPAGKEPAMRACLTDSLEHLKGALAVARGGTATVHVLLNGVPAQAGVNFSVQSGGRALQATRWLRLIDVPVETNTGPRAFVEKKGERNRHVVRRAPFRVYDAMQPVVSPITSAGGTVALRLEVPIARSARPGQRECVVQVRCGDQTLDLPLSVAVHKAVVPPVGKDSLPYTNWFSLTNMAKRHGTGSV